MIPIAIQAFKGKKQSPTLSNLGKLLSAVDFERVAEVLSENQVIDVTPDSQLSGEVIETYDEPIYGVQGRLDRMKEMIEEGRLSPRIRQLVGKIVRKCPERDQMCELKAIHNYIADHTRFLDDTRDLELFQEPELTLKFTAGDCDDLSILAGSMLESAGFKTELVAVGQEDYEHVYIRADYPKPPAKKTRTIGFDLSIPNKQFGFDPTQVENFNKIKIVEIG